jgi:hypothetical protein
LLTIFKPSFTLAPLLNSDSNGSMQYISVTCFQCKSNESCDPSVRLTFNRPYRNCSKSLGRNRPTIFVVVMVHKQYLPIRDHSVYVYTDSRLTQMLVILKVRTVINQKKVLVMCSTPVMARSALVAGQCTLQADCLGQITCQCTCAILHSSAWTSSLFIADAVQVFTVGIEHTELLTAEISIVVFWIVTLH